MMSAGSCQPVADGPVAYSLTADEILRLISSPRKLDRDVGARKLQGLLRKASGDVQPPDELMQEQRRIQEFILNHLNVLGKLSESDAGSTRPRTSTSSTDSTAALEWEIKHGCLLACYPLIDFASERKQKGDLADSSFLSSIQLVTLKLLKEDPTKSVQLAAGSVLGYLSKAVGDEIYVKSRDTIFELITQNLRVPDDETFVPEDQLQSPEAGFDIHLPASLIREKVVKDTLGWTSLEPSLKCLQLTIENLGSGFCKYVDQQLVDLIWACLSHRNRMCRETGFQIVFSLVGCAPTVMKQFEHNLADNLKNGLTDNWNQVRLAASVATRRFLMTYEKEPFYPVLLPRLCFNRYYKSEAVRVYSQESWKLIMGQEGRGLVGRYFSVMVDAYIEAAKSLNPAEREAACSCISELVQKIDKEAVLPQVSRLLGTLTECAKDQTWSVRDAANLAFGSCTKYYPDEAKQFLDDFYHKLFETLEDPMPILRQGAASSLANIVVAYGSEAQSLILDKIVYGLQNIERNQKTEKDSSAGTATTDEAAHIASCERSISGGGRVQVFTMETFASLRPSSPSNAPSTCPGCLISNTAQPWHLVDGCLYLIGAMAEITSCKSELSPLIPRIVRAASIKTYTEHYVILETICKIIPALARSIGKKPFKEFLSLLFDPIFCAVECSNPVTSAAGKQVIRFLAEFIGPNILRSRVELYDSRFINLLEECHIDEVSLSSSSSACSTPTPT